jgi:pimeloyl-ACP methyl ester carboxylesterase
VPLRELPLDPAGRRGSERTRTHEEDEHDTAEQPHPLNCPDYRHVNESLSRCIRKAGAGNREDIDAGIFLPGYLGRARSYEPGLPAGWSALQAPPPVRAQGSLGLYSDWLVEEVSRLRRAVVLAGHSMGAATAVLAAARLPERISRLILVAPSGLPITKSTGRIAHDFLRNVVAKRFCPADVLPPLADAALAPRAAVRLGRALRRLDLSREMTEVRQAAIPATVIACSTDTLTTPASSRRIAELLGARYRELDLEGGHVWMFGRWDLLARELDSAG